MAKTAICSSTSAAATSSCVESGLLAHRRTWAPPATSVRIRLAVSVVTCRHAATRRSFRGRSRVNRSRIRRRTGISVSAHSMRWRPDLTRLTSLTWDSIQDTSGCHCEALKGPKQSPCVIGDCFVATLLAMTNQSQLFDEIFQALASRRMAQLAQRLGLDLADPLAGHPELPADFLQRPGTAIIEPEAQLQHLALTRRQRLQHVLQLLLQHGERRRFGRREGVLVLDEVAQVAVFLFADGRLQRDGFLSNLDDFPHALDRQAHRRRDLFPGRLPTRLLQQGARDAADVFV